MKVVVITGAASGLGNSIAHEFDKEECNLVLCDLNKINKSEFKNEVLDFQLDLTKEENIKKIYNQAVKRFKKIDVVVNNAGVTLKKPFYEFSEKEIDFIINIK